MLNRIIPALFILICFFAGCKKEEETKQGTIEFDVDGVHQTYKILFAVIDDTPTPQGPCVVIRTKGQYSISDFYIHDDSLLTSHLLKPKTYTDDRFVLNYDDTLNCFYQSNVLSQNEPPNTATLQVISCTGNPPVINATFSATYHYGSHCTEPKTITNGKINNVYYQLHK